MFKKLLTKMAIYGVNNPTQFLFWGIFIGYGISSLGEAVGIYYNKDIDKKDRTYMALQDVLEGALKLGTFFMLALLPPTNAGCTGRFGRAPHGTWPAWLPPSLRKLPGLQNPSGRAGPAWERCAGSSPLHARKP